MTHPTESTAQLVTTFDGEFPLSSATDTISHYEITVWLISTGEYDYTLELSNVTFTKDETGNCSQLDNVLLNTIIQEIADHAVEKGVSLGYPACNTTSYERPVRVFCESCGERSGSGCSTTFAACGTEWEHREYEVDCPGDGNLATITLDGGDYSDCSSHTNCEATYIEP